MCAFLLGLAITHNDNSVTGFTQDKLLQLIEKRIGAEMFMDKVTLRRQNLTLVSRINVPGGIIACQIPL